MLSIPENAIQKTQSELFAFLWRNKKIEIKRNVTYQPLSAGGLHFINFRVMVKPLRLSWIGRLLDETNLSANWNKILNYYLDKHGCLAFWYSVTVTLVAWIQIFPCFKELLQYSQELISIYGGSEGRNLSCRATKK